MPAGLKKRSGNLPLFTSLGSQCSRRIRFSANGLLAVARCGRQHRRAVSALVLVEVRAIRVEAPSVNGTPGTVPVHLSR